MIRYALVLALAVSGCATTGYRGESEVRVVASDDARAWRWSVTDGAGSRKCELPCDLTIQGSNELELVGKGDGGSAIAKLPTAPDVGPGTYTATLGAPTKPVALPLAVAAIGLGLEGAAAFFVAEGCTVPTGEPIDVGEVPQCSGRQSAAGAFALSGLFFLGIAAFVAIVEPPVAPVTITRDPSVYR